jgi:hypothetical protein
VQHCAAVLSFTAFFLPAPDGSRPFRHAARILKMKHVRGTDEGLEPIGENASVHQAPAQVRKEPTAAARHAACR